MLFTFLTSQVVYIFTKYIQCHPQELLDRPVRLRFRQKDDDKTESAPEEEKSAEEQHDES